MNGLLIRRLAAEDLPACQRLFYDTIHTVNRRDYSQEQVDTWAPMALDADRLARWATLLDSHAFVAEEAGRVVGFADYLDDGLLDRFYVHQDRQGAGVGTRLLSALESHAAARGVARLHTEASITARPFFLRRGYREVAEQTVVHRGVAFVNCRMEKALCHG